MSSKANKLFHFFEEVLPKEYNTTNIRASQVQMAMDIAAFLDNHTSEDIMIIEAPVGTGKSLGSLVPATFEMSYDKSTKIVYATATINLQGQLMNSEVPLLKKIGLIKQPLLAKGKTHYYCHQEMLRNKRKLTREQFDHFTNFFYKSSSGQRNELEDCSNEEISNDLWKKISIQGGKGNECEYCDYSYLCPSNSHRKMFMSRQNDLIVTNHDQLIRSVLNVTDEYEREPIIPINPGILIIDEAHHFQENFLNQLEKSLSLRKLQHFKKLVPQKLQKLFENYIYKLNEVFMNEIKKQDISIQGRYPLPPSANSILGRIEEILDETLNIEISKEINRYFLKSSISSELEESLDLVHSFQNTDDYVTWLNLEDKTISAISRTFPSDFRKLFNRLSAYNKIIIMSGTLTVSGDFNRLLEQWRLKSDKVITKKINSPFDYKNQAIVYVPTDLLPVHHENFIMKNIEQIKSLIRLTEGKTLILTTAKTHLNEISDSIMEFTKELEIDLLRQDQSGVETLTKLFRENEKSVLVGSGSFFSGFSIPGQSLISVILNKLPFSVPEDPFLKLIGEGYEDELFKFIYIPNMINKLNQAAGRLIRDITDFGIFTILDSRVLSNQDYGVQVQNELSKQGYEITSSFEEVVHFLERKLIHGSEANYSKYCREGILVSDFLKEPILIVKKKNQVTHENNYKVKQSPSQNRNVITKEQEEFAKSICEEENQKYPTKIKKTEKLYQFLIDIFYKEWRDTSKVKLNFPFIDDKQKSTFQRFEGTSRKIVAPKCIDVLKCTGQCNSQIKTDAQKQLLDLGVKNVSFIECKNQGYCLIVTEPGNFIQENKVEF